MTRNSVYGHEYFKYYKAACGMKLKITRLYDYYLRSMDRSCFVKLPMSLLTYYSYDTSLDDELKSYLYAYLLDFDDPFGFLTWMKKDKRFQKLHARYHEDDKE